ncbi:uncharacterized protein [Parasteatoda tepidariorum]|uniref:uncharacterized protein n=1 Tax=Parasteatoda tepidariorum TaxID=114398 RepID=UPI0039BD41D7
MRQELVINETFSHLIPRNIMKEQTISLHNLELNDDYRRALCPTAYHCLGYQACIFTYSRDLCQGEPLPLLPEYFVLSIGCYRDDLFDAPKKFQKHKDFVLYIEYTPNGRMPEMGFSISNLTYVESSEDTVFNGKCPPLGVAKKEGYFGNCIEYLPPFNVISLELWPALGKSQSEICRSKIIQTLCALHYNSQGLCIPPVYRNKNLKENKLFNSLVFPQHKNSFNLEEYKKFLDTKIPELVPARLAFVIMTKKNIEGTISVLQSIYRDHFLYAVHIDKEEQLREELESQIEKSFPTRHNIILVPTESSFSTTFDSYETVRAKMEAYENLLHLGIWDFVVTLNEDDVLLRNIDDLAIALAPYRGLSFLPDLHAVEKQASVPIVSCEGLIHEFPSLSNAFRTKSNLIFYNSSDDGILSREFVEYLVDENRHSKEVNEQQFFLQTLHFSYNAYIPTLMMNSPFKNTVNLAPIRITKKKLIKNITNDSSQVDEDSIAFEEEKIKMEKEYFFEKDATLINKLSHRYFFGQKFSSSLKDDAQKFAIQLASGEYYQHLEKLLPMPVIRSLLEETLKIISQELKINSDISIESVMNIQIVPSLVPQQELCQSKLISAHSNLNIDYTYWIDFLTYFRTDGKQQKTRIMLEPSMNSRLCFKSENLRMISLSSWNIEQNQDSSSNWASLQENIPVPYFSSNIRGIVINFLVADEVQSFIEKGNVVHLKGKSGPIEVKISLQSPTKSTRCFESTEIILAEKYGAYSYRDEASNKDLLVKLHSIFIACDNMETGFWIAKISQTHPRISREYVLQFYVLDLSDQTNVDALSKDIGSLWSLKHFAFITKNDSYNFYSDEVRQSSNFIRQRDSTKKKTISRQEKILELETSPSFNRRSDKTYLFICGGGLISSFAVFLTVIVLFCGWKYRFHPKMVLCFVSLLCLITGFQIVIIVSVCN